RFGGDPHVLGRQVLTYDDGVAYTIVGVMPHGLDYPRGTDCWAPVVPSTVPKDLYVIGRIAAGRTAADAQDELTAVFRRPGGSRWQWRLAPSAASSRSRRLASRAWTRFK